MFRQSVMAAILALLLTDPVAAADHLTKRPTYVPERGPSHNDPKDRGNQEHDRDRDHDRDRGENHDRDHGRDRDHDRRDDDRRDRDWRGDDWRDHDWRRDDDWHRRGWQYDGWRNDGWRYYRGHDNRHWRYVPPYRYSLDFGYRSGYELAWRDWLDYGRYDRYWRRSSFYGFGVGYTYSAGYEAGWRDAGFYYGRGYRPDSWAYDPQGGWYFSFRIEG